MEREYRFKPRRVLIVLGGLLGICVGIVYFVYKSNVSNFLSTLKKYEGSKALLAQEWPTLASQAKTSMHYLMLLKRLHAYGLDIPYERVLIRAMWKHKEVSSIVALGVDYFLKQYTIENNRIITINTHSAAVHKELKKFLDGAVDVLWERYPNMVRLYYITSTLGSDNATLGVFPDDALLRLYEKLRKLRVVWQDYRMLWELTAEQSFLYLFIAHAQRAGKTQIAEQAYEKFLNMHTPSYAPRNTALISHIALLMRDIVTLRALAERKKTEEVILNLVSAYIYAARQNEAWEVMRKHEKLAANFSPMWGFVYFWLSARRAQFTPARITQLYMRAREKYPNQQLLFAYEYWIYCYKKDRDYSENECVLDTSLFPEDFWTDPQVAFLKAEKQRAVSIQPALTALWSVYNASKGSEFWMRVLVTYVLKHALYEDFVLLQNKHAGSINMLPYEFFFAVDNKNERLVESFMNSFAQAQAKGDNINHKLPWWYYYNMAVQYNKIESYENAEKALHRAESLYRSSYYYNTYPYMPYIWIQYAYAARGKNDMETAYVFLNKIRDVQPTFAYLQKFEN